MIPKHGCDPEINVVSIGAKILRKLLDGNVSLTDIISAYPNEIEVSVDHIILSLDWLFAIKAIDFDGSEVLINEAK